MLSCDIRWPALEYLAAGEHGRGDATTLMHLGEYDGDEMQNDHERQRVKREFVDGDKRSPEGPHRLVGGRVNQIGGARLDC